MEERLLRQMPLIENTENLKNKTVAVLGLGGVGGSAAVALARAGVGSLILVDHDTFSETNLNRQIFAFKETIGKKKCDVAREYISKIDDSIEIKTLDIFFSNETKELLFSEKVDFIIDAIDTVSAKKTLIIEATKRGVPIISSMGTGNRLNPEFLKIGKIKDTKGNGCPLARIMRKELLKEGIEDTPVVFSSEMPIKVSVGEENGKHSPASAVFVPQSAGILSAYFVISNL